MTKLKTVELKYEYGYEMDGQLFDYINQQFVDIMDSRYGIDLLSKTKYNIYGNIYGYKYIAFDSITFTQKEVEKMLGIKVLEGIEIQGWTKMGNYSASYGVDFDLDDWNKKDWNKKVAMEGEKVLSADEVEGMFEELMEDIERVLIKYGENTFEWMMREEIIFVAFREWLEKNKIEGDYFLGDFSYLTEESFAKEKEGYTQVATSGDTSIDGLWVALELEEKERVEKYYVIKD